MKIISKIAEKLRSSTPFRDGVILFFVYSLMLILSIRYDVLKWIYGNVHTYEAFHLEKLLPPLVVGVICFGVFALRRGLNTGLW